MIILEFILQQFKNIFYAIGGLVLILSPIFIPIALINYLPSAKPVYIVAFWVELVIVIGIPFLVFFWPIEEKWIILERVIAVFLFIMLMATHALPMIKDIPVLLTGRYSYLEGQPTDFKSPSRTFTEYITVDGETIAFTLESVMWKKENRAKYYRVEYLPNSKFGINAIEIQK